MRMAAILIKLVKGRIKQNQDVRIVLSLIGLPNGSIDCHAMKQTTAICVTEEPHFSYFAWIFKIFQFSDIVCAKY